MNIYGNPVLPVFLRDAPGGVRRERKRGSVYRVGLSAAPQAEPQALGFPSGLSAAPQAEPQALGFSSGLSAAPQAEPQALGFSSGLSAAPQAEPQAEAGADSIRPLHPNRLESAI